MSEMVLPRFILCIIQYLRDGYIEPGENTHDNAVLFLRLEIMYFNPVDILTKAVTMKTYIKCVRVFQKRGIKSIPYCP